MSADNGKTAFRFHQLNEVEKDLAQQRSRLEGCYRDNPTGAIVALAEFDIARAAYLRLHRRDRLLDYGTLVPNRAVTNPLHVVRLVRDSNSGPFRVIKVEGNVSGLGESAALAAFLRHGLPCVSPLDEHIERVGVNESTADARVFSTRYIPGAVSLGRKYPLAEFADRARLVGALTKFLAPFYDSGATLTSPNSWMGTMTERLERAISTETEAKTRRNLTLARAALRDLDGHPDVLLHGNPHEDNVVEDPSGRWWLLDPGQSVGPPDGEIGTMASDFAVHPSEIALLVDEAAGANPKLNRNRLLCFAGVGSVLRSYRPEQFRGSASADEWRAAGIDLVNSSRRRGVASPSADNALDRSLRSADTTGLPSP